MKRIVSLSVLVVVALLLFLSCATAPAPSVSGRPNPQMGYIFGAFHQTTPDHQAELLISGRSDYTIRFGDTPRVRVFELEPGEYRLQRVTVQNVRLDFSDNEDLSRPLIVRPGELTYVGDWLSYVDRTIQRVGIRRIHNYVLSDVEELEEEYPDFAELPLESYLPGVPHVDGESLDVGQIRLVRNQEIDQPVSVVPFFQAYATMGILSDLELYDAMTDSQQVELMNAFFDDLPASVEKSTVVARVGVGAHLAEERPLLISVVAGAFREGIELEGALYVVAIQTNVETANGDPTGAEATSPFDFMPPQGYTREFVLYENGTLVSAAVIADSATMRETILAADTDPVAAINAADTITRDSILENDVRVPTLLNDLVDNPDLEPTIRVAARLNTLMFELSRGDIDAAENQLAALAPDARAIRDETFRHAIEKQAPAVIMLTRSALNE